MKIFGGACSDPVPPSRAPVRHCSSCCRRQRLDHQANRGGAPYLVFDREISRFRQSWVRQKWCNDYAQNCVKFPKRKKSGKTFSRAKMGVSSAAAYLAAHTWQPGQHFNCLKTQHRICRCFNILPTAPNIANITQYNITKYFPTKIFGRFFKYFGIPSNLLKSIGSDCCNKFLQMCVWNVLNGWEFAFLQFSEQVLLVLLRLRGKTQIHFESDFWAFLKRQKSTDMFPQPRFWLFKVFI